VWANGWGTRPDAPVTDQEPPQLPDRFQSLPDGNRPLIAIRAVGMWPPDLIRSDLDTRSLEGDLSICRTGHDDITSIDVVVTEF